MQLSDGDQIRGLLGRYCRLMDEGDFLGVGELFARARLLTLDGGELGVGAVGAEQLYAGLVKIGPDGTPGTQHVVVNTEIEASGDGGAIARSSYVVLQAVAGLPLQPVVTGSYVDTFAQEPGEDGSWYFTERRFGIGLTGELSHHLSIPTTPTSEAGASS